MRAALGSSTQSFWPDPFPPLSPPERRATPKNEYALRRQSGRVFPPRSQISHGNRSSRGIFGPVARLLGPVSSSRHSGVCKGSPRTNRRGGLKPTSPAVVSPPRGVHSTLDVSCAEVCFYLPEILPRSLYGLPGPRLPDSCDDRITVAAGREKGPVGTIPMPGSCLRLPFRRRLQAPLLLFFRLPARRVGLRTRH